MLSYSRLAAIHETLAAASGKTFVSRYSSLNQPVEEEILMKMLSIATIIGVAFAPLAATAGGAKVYYGKQQASQHAYGYVSNGSGTVAARGVTTLGQKFLYEDGPQKQMVDQMLEFGFEGGQSGNGPFEFGAGAGGKQGYEGFFGRE